jgi:hypothetical protein
LDEFYVFAYKERMRNFDIRANEAGIWENIYGNLIQTALGTARRRVVRDPTVGVPPHPFRKKETERMGYGTAERCD